MQSATSSSGKQQREYKLEAVAEAEAAARNERTKKQIDGESSHVQCKAKEREQRTGKSNTGVLRRRFHVPFSIATEEIAHRCRHSPLLLQPPL